MREYMKTKGFVTITEKNTSDFFEAGVWIMFGKSKENHKYECLNVGKNNNIGKELAVDFSRIGNFIEKEDEPKDYVNQFGEKIFDYTVYAERLDFLYHHIDERYENIFCIKICDKSDYSVEKYAAYLFRAKYWVANRQKPAKITDNEIEQIQDKIIISNEDRKFLEDLKTEFYTFNKLGSSQNAI